ncbi:MAG: hypothetical protein AAGE43_16085 [Pseudomonadota bacterium]
MPTVSETIPEALQPRVDAAVAWFNSTGAAAGDEFKATGILDPEESVADSGELRLILCGGDRCEQHTFLVEGSAEDWQISFAETALSTQAGKPQAELDPPPGPRLRWLDNVLARHEFVLLLFYRGFW